MGLFDAALRECSDDLLEQALHGDLHLVVGRESEARQIEDLLLSRRSVLVVGEAGVGKSAVVRRVLSSSVRTKADGSGLPLKMFRTSTSRLIADTKYLGEWQSKLTTVVRELEEESQAVLYLTDVWNLTSVGRSESNDETMADLFKEFVESQRVVLLGEITKQQIAFYFDRMPSFRNLFVQVLVGEVPADTVRPILFKVAGSLASGAGLGFLESAIERAIELTDRFQPYRHQPGKAIELVERAMHRVSDRRDTDGPASLDAAMVEETFSETTGLPMFVVSDSVRMATSAIRQFFQERVLGQEHALDRIVDTIALYKAGLNDPSKPIGTFLFVGPTGVGKTELAKALAEFLFGSEARMLRFDMSEYKDYHSFEKLIGDPKRPGPGGSLVEGIRAHPFAVVLLDEFEKAHSNIADLLLQVFDDGRLTDARGQTVDFRNAIIVLTSNVGTDARLQGRAIHGFSGGEDETSADHRIRKALDETFRPEFLNRIEHLVVFRELTRETVRRIAMRELSRIYTRRGIANRGIAVEIDDRLLDRVLDQGFNPKYGARALKREIAAELVVPLAVALMESPVEPGQILRLEPRAGEGTRVRFIDTEESLRSSAVEEEVSVEGRRLTIAEVADLASAMSSKLGIVAADHGMETLERRIDEIREAQGASGYWSDQSRAFEQFEEYNRLVGKVRLAKGLGDRFADLERRAREALKRRDSSIREALVRECVRAEIALDRFEVELATFTDADDCPALVSIRVMGATDADFAWLDRMTAQYAAWAVAVGRPFDVLYDRSESDGMSDGLSVVRIDGPYAAGYLRGETGIHRLRDVGDGPVDTHSVSAVGIVEVWPLGSGDGGGVAEIVSAEKVRARGMRLERLSSRVVARLGGRTLMLQNGWNVDKNRTLAGEVLASAASDASASSSEPVRTYHLAGRKKIRDPRTALAVTGRGVDAYLAGGLDAFLRRNAVALKQADLY